MRINGKPLELNGPSPAVKKVRDFLLKQGADEVFGTAEIQKHCNVSERITAKTRYFEGLTFRYRGKNYWGSPTAIKNLRKLVSA